jgi:hypothetical protein
MQEIEIFAFKDTIFEKIFKNLDLIDFLKYTSKEIDEERDRILIDFIKEGKLKREDIIDLMLSDEGRRYYRGTIVGRKYGF